MDNRTIDVTAEGDAPLKAALSIIWPNAAGGKATHYVVTNIKHEVNYWANEPRENGSEPNCNAGLHPVEDRPQFVVHHTEQDVVAPDGEPTLILLWHDERDSTALPYPLDMDGAYDFIIGWLQQADYGREPDHDGSNGKGWRLFADFWGHVSGYHCAIVGVQPTWAMYGK